MNAKHSPQLCPFLTTVRQARPAQSTEQDRSDPTPHLHRSQEGRGTRSMQTHSTPL